MIFNNNIFNHRKNKTLQKKISFILYNIAQKEGLFSCSISYSMLSKKGENLWVYLNYYNKDYNINEWLMLLNNKYKHDIKKKLAQTEQFSFIPQITFLVDKKTSKIDELESYLIKTKN